VESGGAAIDLSIIFDGHDMTIAWVSADLGAGGAWTSTSMSGRIIADIIHPQDAAETIVAMRAAADGTGPVPRRPVRLADDTGEWHSFTIHAVRPIQRNDRTLVFVRFRREAPMDVAAVATEAEQRYMALVDSSIDGIIVHDGAVVMFANAAAATLLGAPSASDLVGVAISSFVRPEDRVALDRVRWQLTADPDEGQQANVHVRRFTDEVVAVHATFASVTWHGRPAIQMVLRNVRTDSHSAARTRGAAHHGADAANEAVISADASFRIDSWNAAAERLYGWLANEALGRRVGDVIGLDQDPHRVQEAMDTLFRTGHWSGISQQRHRDGRVIEVEAHTTLFRDANGDVASIVSVNSGIKRPDDDGIDRLTGLIGRSSMLAVLGHSTPSHAVLVVLLDIDNFSDLNAKMGIAAGDIVLAELASRLRGAIRAGDILARVSGDRFAVFGPVFDEADAKAVAARLHSVVSEPIDAGDTLISLAASAGAAWDGECVAPHRLFEQAERALREAKTRGGRRMCFYGPSTEAGGWDDDSTFVSDVRAAIAAGEMYLAYQPIVELSSGRLRKMEALARWKHPVRGVIPPTHFIPLAERSGMIIELGYWILERACRDALAMSAEREEFGMCVNLSAAQLRDPALPERVAAVLADTGMLASNLWIEVTESVLVDDKSIEALRRLHALGVRLVIDDFGTGYATLQLLTRLPVDALKIDRSFISGLGVEAGDTAIVRSVINLGRELGLQVVAEGVETESQRAQLLALNCRLAQGWLFGYPFPVDEVLQTLRSPRAAAPLPEDAGVERMRLDALEACRVLDTSAEDAYDALVQLAARILEMPMALISLVHEDREWFKARVGVEISETSRDISFCTHAICDPHHTFMVPDASLDPRFADNPFVTGDMHLRFYAGAPIRSREDLALGTLCVLDSSPRTLTDEQLATLTLLADQAAALLDLRRRAAELNDLIRNRVEVTTPARRELAEATIDPDAQSVELGAANRRIEQQREFIDTTLDNLTDAVVACDADGVLTVFNLAARKLHDLTGRPVPSEEWAATYDLFNADGSAPLQTEEIPLHRALYGHRVVDSEITIVPAGRPPRLVRCNGQQLRDRAGHVLGAVVVMQDITAQRKVEAMLRRQALNDQLAEMAGREQVIGKVEALLRHPATVRLAHIDSEQIGQLEERLGHRLAEHLRAKLADRLFDISRPTDIVARLGNDEFVIVQRVHGASAERDDGWLRRLRECTSFASTADGADIEVRVACGVIHGVAGENAVELLRRADEAMSTMRQRRVRH